MIARELDEQIVDGPEIGDEVANKVATKILKTIAEWENLAARLSARYPLLDPT
jgi:hypothetical protein